MLRKSRKGSAFQPPPTDRGQKLCQPPTCPTGQPNNSCSQPLAHAGYIRPTLIPQGQCFNVRNVCFYGKDVPPQLAVVGRPRQLVCLILSSSGRPTLLHPPTTARILAFEIRLANVRSSSRKRFELGQQRTLDQTIAHTGRRP